MLEALLLGGLQGLTEFLPVSSSGHLVIAQAFLGWQDPALFLNILLHVATLVVIVWYYRNRFFTLSRLQLIALFAGCVPTAIIGLLIRHYAAWIFARPDYVGGLLLINAGVLLSLKYTRETLSLQTIRWQHGCLIGLAQACAILPGISRVGASVAMAMWLGYKARDAVQFSFFLAIPAILGALALELVSPETVVYFDLSYGIGMLAALLSGYLAVRILVATFEARCIWPYAVYCAMAGSLAIVLT